MNGSITLSTVLGETFFEEVKKELPKLTETMQFHIIQWIIREVALFIENSFPEASNSIDDSKDIVLRELGDCCSLIQIVCKGDYERVYIDSDNVRLQ